MVVYDTDEGPRAALAYEGEYGGYVTKDEVATKRHEILVAYLLTAETKLSVAAEGPAWRKHSSYEPLDDPQSAYQTLLGDLPDDMREAVEEIVNDNASRARDTVYLIKQSFTAIPQRITKHKVKSGAYAVFEVEASGEPFSVMERLSLVIEKGSRRYGMAEAQRLYQRLVKRWASATWEVHGLKLVRPDYSNWVALMRLVDLAEAPAQAPGPSYSDLLGYLAAKSFTQVRIIVFELPSEYRGAKTDLRAEKREVEAEGDTSEKKKKIYIEERELEYDPNLFRSLRKAFYERLHRIAWKSRIGWILYHDADLSELDPVINRLRHLREALRIYVRPIEIITVLVPRDFVVREINELIKVRENDAEKWKKRAEEAAEEVKKRRYLREAAEARAEVLKLMEETKVLAAVSLDAIEAQITGADV